MRWQSGLGRSRTSSSSSFAGPCFWAVALALAVFELWTVLAAIVLLIVAVVFATNVVLDYVMGFLLLVEGPFFKGDYVVVRDHAGAEGVVEEIGLRRTLLRDALGSSHAVSNGYIRLSSNLTRLFSVAVVELHVPQTGELHRALATVARVAGDMRADAAWADQFLADAPTAFGSPGSAWTAPRSGSSSVSRRVPRWPSRANFGGGWPQLLRQPRSGQGGGIPHADREPTSQPTIGQRIAGLALRLAINEAGADGITGAAAPWDANDDATADSAGEPRSGRIGTQAIDEGLSFWPIEWLSSVRAHSPRPASGSVQASRRGATTGRPRRARRSSR